MAESLGETQWCFHAYWQRNGLHGSPQHQAAKGEMSPPAAGNRHATFFYYSGRFFSIRTWSIS